MSFLSWLTSFCGAAFSQEPVPHPSFAEIHTSAVDLMGASTAPLLPHWDLYWWPLEALARIGVSLWDL
jgi:hypothetical protein